VASPREFFERGDIDAMLLSAEAGSAWTIQYPSYAVAIPQPDVITHPLGYAVPQGDVRFTEFVNRWIELERGHLDHKRLDNHWILGKDVKEKRASFATSCIGSNNLPFGFLGFRQPGVLHQWQ
jgi:hypothetical protein